MSETNGSQPVTVIKRNLQGEETWRYTGKLLEKQDGVIRLEAWFDREDLDVAGMPMIRGDRFVETYYTDRWYNINEVHAREDDRLRGWYCNISLPVQSEGEGVISYVDLALDLVVFPDGRQVVVDQDEFAALNISEEVRRRAEESLAELQRSFTRRPAGR